MTLETKKSDSIDRIPGNSFFLYSDNSGSTYLYVEQQQGARRTAFDVTDPSKIKVVTSSLMTEFREYYASFPALLLQ
jgi:hypothetical protein